PVALSAICIALGGCQTSTTDDSKSTDSLPEGVSATEFTQDLIAGDRYYEVTDADIDGGKYYITISCNIQWPRQLGDYDLKPLQDSIVTTLSMRGATTLPEAIDKYLSDLTAWETEATRIDSLPESTGSEIRPNEFYAKTDISISEVTDSYITVNRYWEQYSGGAHPMYASSAFTYAYTLGRVMSYDQLFKANSESVVLPVVIAEIARANGFSSPAQLEQNLIVDKIPITTNVSIREGVIVFHYNPYEILPYSYGSIDAEVSPYEVRDALTPEAVKFFGMDQ
ncbi:MAG: DUF3298 and DUF4163 domain-containing protein, partial [Paramuribaculum sp.]|nr:DUF3298 and DUF4163 domain-containing protein [Paramuribaculum sp.]